MTATLTVEPTDVKFEETTETAAIRPLKVLSMTPGYFCSCGCEKCAANDHCMTRPHCLH